MSAFTKVLIVGAIGVAGYLGYASFVGPASNSAETTEAGADAAQMAAAPEISHPSITVAPASLAVLHDSIRSSGLVGAVERIILQPKIEGQAVESIDAEVGDHVAAGAVLARLSETSLKLELAQLAASRASALSNIAQSEAQLIEAESNAQEAMRTQERTKALQKQGNASQTVADQAATAATGAAARVLVAAQGAEAAKAQLNLVDAQIDNVNLQLSRTQITAPVAGEVVERNAVAGAIASASGAPMFILVRDGLLELSADVAEQDLPRLSVGMNASLRVAGSNVPLTGSVRLVEPAIDAVTRLGRARITIDQADRVRTGMFLEAEITVSRREVISVPITALATDDLGPFVMVVDQTGKVHRTTVATGVRDGGLIEIQSGLSQGDLVIAKAASFVRDGDIVNPVAAMPAPVTN